MEPKQNKQLDETKIKPICRTSVIIPPLLYLFEEMVTYYCISIFIE